VCIPNQRVVETVAGLYCRRKEAVKRCCNVLAALFVLIKERVEDHEG
jgi:hypothetical protein